jgi:hypothetical protein
MEKSANGILTGTNHLQLEEIENQRMANKNVTNINAL